MEKYFGKLIEDYEKVLNDEFENLKKRISKRLEGMLNEKIPQENLLDMPFDYDSLKNNKIRIRNRLKPFIETYGDLQKLCYEEFVEKNGGGRSWRGEKEYSIYLEGFQNFGKLSIHSIISHLKSVNFDFSEATAKKAFGKSN